jgi:hypothetical protein
MNAGGPAREVPGAETWVDVQHRTPIVVPMDLIADQIMFPETEIRTMQSERKVRRVQAERQVF